jgi:ankyrin repeat protein
LGVVRFLVEQGADVSSLSAADLFDDSDISDNGDIESEHEEEGGQAAHPAWIDLTEISCMVAAAAGGNTEVLEYLSTRGVLLEQHWEAAVAGAAKGGHLEAVQWLLCKALPALTSEVQGVSGEQPSHAEARQGPVRAHWRALAVSRLLYSTSPLVQAALGGHLGILRLLLQTGRWSSQSEVNQALVAASLRGHVELMQLLLQHGADVNNGASVFTRDGPLGLALTESQLAAAELLILRGATIDAAALVCAAQSAKSLLACQLLLKQASPHAPFIDSQNQSLYSAAYAGMSETVDLLLAADTKLLQTGGMAARLRTALYGAAKGGHLLLLKSLLQSLQEKLSKRANGAAKLHAIMSTALTEAVKGLREHCGRPCAWLSPYFEHHAIIRLLLERTAPQKQQG